MLDISTTDLQQALQNTQSIRSPTAQLQKRSTAKGMPVNTSASGADTTAPAISSESVAALIEVRLDWRHKAVPDTANGTKHSGFIASGHTLADLQTPLLTLDAGAIRDNADRLASWSKDHGVLLAPHGKTTMAPQLWAEQLNRGAWGITLANFAQLRVARQFG